MKHLEGKEVYLRGTGNNEPRGGRKPEFTKAKIIKVARVFVTFMSNGYEQKMRVKGNRLSNGCNGGYEVYETEQGIKDYFLASELSSKIVSQFRYKSDLQKLDVETLKKVAELLGV